MEKKGTFGGGQHGLQRGLQGTIKLASSSKLLHLNICFYHALSQGLALKAQAEAR